MRTKIAQSKGKQDLDIVSDDGSIGEERVKDNLKKDGAVTRDMIQGDPFFATGEDENETAEEKRLKMTKKLIKDLGEESKNNDDFFFNL